MPNLIPNKWADQKDKECKLQKFKSCDKVIIINKYLFFKYVIFVSIIIWAT